jgi:CRISPR-associated endoribonuclease Cas6
MRLKLTLNHRPNVVLSLNYAYALQAVIYKVLERADPQFSRWLHERGYEVSGRNFKLFTFSELRGLPFFIDKNAKTIEYRGNTLTWYVSFCVDEGVETFISGLFQDQILEVMTPEGRIHCTVAGVEMQTLPEFEETMQYRALTPICITEQSDTDKYPQFRSPLDATFEQLFFNNLDYKTKAAFGSSPTPTELGFRLLSEPRMKGLLTHKRHLLKPIKTIGYTFDFELTAPIEWQMLGYNAGFGGKNSSGFGFCDILK